MTIGSPPWNKPTLEIQATPILSFGTLHVALAQLKPYNDSKGPTFHGKLGKIIHWKMTTGSGHVSSQEGMYFVLWQYIYIYIFTYFICFIYIFSFLLLTSSMLNI